jgi:hypothetical protein
MIHPGLLLDPEYTKMDPTHWPLEICAELKSVGEIDQDWPPKENATLTVVEHAMEMKICQHNSTGKINKSATHGRDNTPRNCQYPQQSWESEHIRKRLDQQDRQ